MCGVPFCCCPLIVMVAFFVADRSYGWVAARMGSRAPLASPTSLPVVMVMVSVTLSACSAAGEWVHPDRRDTGRPLLPGDGAPPGRPGECSGEDRGIPLSAADCGAGVPLLFASVGRAAGSHGNGLEGGQHGRASQVTQGGRYRSTGLHKQRGCGRRANSQALRQSTSEQKPMAVQLPTELAWTFRCTAFRRVAALRDARRFHR